MARTKRDSRAASPEAAQGDTTDRRTLVLQAAASAFAELGYQGTSILDICEGAGIAKPTVYHYFPSKAAILFQLLYDWIELMITAVEAPERLELSPPERLLEVMKDMVGWLDSHPGETRLFYEDALAFLTPAMRKRITQRREHFSQHVEEILIEGRESGFFRFDDARMTRLCVFAMCGWPQTWYRPGGGVTTEEIATYAFELIMSGISVERTGPSGSNSKSRAKRASARLSAR